MDNAQKAIMIGVGLFITIIIISAVLLITNVGTGMMNSAQSQLSTISKTLQSQVTQAFDGKVMTGADVIAACQQYQDSDLSIVIYAGKGVRYKTGKYNLIVTCNGMEASNTLKSDGTANTATGAIAANSSDQVYPYTTVPGGVKCKATSTRYQELTDTSRDALATIQSKVTSTQAYYANILKDKDTDTVMGIVFVRKGIA